MFISARAVRASFPRWQVLPALRAAAVYLLFAGVWIYLSDHWVQSLHDADFAAVVGTWKGLLFALVTALLFFMTSLKTPVAVVAVRRRTNVWSSPVLWVVLLLMALVFAIGWTAYREQREAVTNGVESDMAMEADLKAQRIAELYASRKQQAAVLRSDPLAARLIARWLQQRTPADEQQIREWLAAARSSLQLEALTLFDADGEPLLGDVGAAGAQARRDAVRSAARRGEIVLGDLHRDQPGGALHFELAAPLAGAPVHAVLVLGQRAEGELLSILRAPGGRAGGDFSYLTTSSAQGLQVLAAAPRGDAGSVYGSPVTAASAGSAARGERRIRHFSDARGVAVLAYAAPVADTPWQVVVQIDEAQAYAGVREDGWAIGGLLLTAGLLSLLLVRYFLQRSELRSAFADVEQARALQASEQRFRETFDNASIGMAMVSLDGRILRVNSVLCAMSGYDADELLQMSTLDLVHPDDRAGLLQRREALLQTEFRAAYEQRYVRKDGSVLWVEVSPSIVRDAQERPLYQIGAIKDVTPRRLAEEAYRQSEERFRLAMRGARQGVWDWDLASGAVYFSEHWATMLGYESGDLRPEIATYRGLMDEESGRRMQQQLDSVSARRSEFFAFEGRFRHRDGHDVHILSRAFPVFGEDGALRRLVGTHINVSERKAIEAALRHRISVQDYISRIAGALPGALYTFKRNPDGSYCMPYTSPPFEAMFGVRCEDVIDSVAPAFGNVHEDDLPGMVASVEASAARLEPWKYEFRARRADGEYAWIEGRSTPYRDPDGSVMWYGFLLDVGERKTQERRLRQAATVLAGMREGVVVTDARSVILAANPACCEITGYGEQELLGSNVRILRSGLQDQAFYQTMWSALRSEGYWQGEIWNRRKNGEIFPVWLTISGVRDEAGQLSNYVGAFSDITLVKESEARLDYLAHHDVLTGLPNRLLLRSRLEQALRLCEAAQTTGAVLMLDLDRFKNVNDVLGHPAGDDLLVITAQRLKDCVQGHLVARLGGDEFVVVVEKNADAESVAGLAARLIACVEQPFQLSGGRQACVGLSIGISLFPCDGRSASDLMRHADAALYQAKDAGRGTFRFYSSALTREAAARLDLEAQLRHALEQNEFELHYQPLVSLPEGRIEGAEALLRWRRPEGKAVPPSEFVPIAESTGQIVPLGEWALREACTQLRRWREAGHAFKFVAVNLSPRQLAQPDIIARIAGILRETGLPPACLELEITEGTLAGDPLDVQRKLRELKALGVRIAVDDFGTGYSSLLYLKRFPIDKIKIDQGFVRDLPDDATDAELVTAITALGSILHLEVLAEGVETEAQAQFLLRHGCRLAQGFRFSAALPSAAFAALPPRLGSLDVPAAAEAELLPLD